MDKKVFQQFPQADAAFSCTILEENQENPENKRNGIQYDPREKWGFEISPMKFYELKFVNRLVLFHTNSITLKRNFLVQGKCFDTRLRLHQDSELWNRLMRRGHFYAGDWNQPVAVVRRHAGNRITGRSNQSQIKMLAILMENIGWDNLAPFEKEYYLKQIERNRSKRFENHWLRRFYYYTNCWIHGLQKDRFLKKLIKKYAVD